MTIFSPLTTEVDAVMSAENAAGRTRKSRPNCRSGAADRIMQASEAFLLTCRAKCESSSSLSSLSMKSRLPSMRTAASIACTFTTGNRAQHWIAPTNKPAKDS